MTISTAQPRVLADAFPQGYARTVALVVGTAAFVGLAAQVSIPLPFTPVPLTGQTFAVLLSGAALGPLRAVAAMMLYLVAGLAGVPWFAEGSSGTSPSFGYVIGFIAAGLAVGWVAERGWTRTPVRTAVTMALGNVVIYAFGVMYLKQSLNLSMSAAIDAGLTPFLGGDAIKIAFAAGLFPLAWRFVQKQR